MDSVPGQTQYRLNWRLSIQIAPDAEPIDTAFTNSRIVLSVLNTGILTGAKWDVEITLADTDRTITRVRIYDNREDVCTGGDLKQRPDGRPVRPLTPTAFADESPRKWGFFFSLGSECKEYKGTSLDVYRVVEEAWLHEGSVLLTFDGNDQIVGASYYVGD